MAAYVYSVNNELSRPSAQPVVSQHTPLTLTPMATPLSIDLESSSNNLLGIPARRERANSEGDVHVAAQISALPPSPLASVSKAMSVCVCKLVVTLVRKLM